MADRTCITVFFPTPLIFRYHLPLNYEATLLKTSWQTLDFEWKHHEECCGSGSASILIAWTRILVGWGASTYRGRPSLRPRDKHLILQF
jgi:hypothetical protein